MLKKARIAFEIRDGFVGSISVLVPWTMLFHDSMIDVVWLLIALRLSPKQSLRMKVVQSI